MKTLQSAITLMEPADIQIAFVNNRLDYITQNPLNITEFTLSDSGKIHEELKVQFNLNHQINNDIAQSKKYLKYLKQYCNNC